MFFVKKQLGSWQRRLGKTVVIKAGTYIVSRDRKTTVYGLEASKSHFLKNAYKLSIATRSRVSLSLSLYHLYSSEPVFIIQYDTVQAPVDTLSDNLSLVAVWIKLSLTRI